VVRAAADPASPDAEHALATLCRTYWYPLYAYLRRLGHSREDARDLTQAFFVKLLEERTIAVADPARGKFRSFLLTALKHFVANHGRQARAGKRGSGRAPTSVDFLDFEHAEGRYDQELAHTATPEEVFERRWAFTLLEQLVDALGREYREAGHAELFAHLKGVLGGDAQTVSYREIASALGMTEGAVKVAVHRLRRRCRELLLAEIEQTVADPADADDELRRWRTLILSGGM
jgi:RNA polymerase sigma factor (sigma-70 family)